MSECACEYEDGDDDERVSETLVGSAELVGTRVYLLKMPDMVAHVSLSCEELIWMYGEMRNARCEMWSINSQSIIDSSPSELRR